MAKQAIQFKFDDETVWNLVHGRRSVFLDTNAWIHMSDEVDDTARRVRDDLRVRVASGTVFCPVSWGTLEELFLQAGASLPRTAVLMEELSLNACIIMRKELLQWEFARSLGRCLDAPPDDTLRGMFTNPAAFTRSRPCVTFEFHDDQVLGSLEIANAQAEFQKEMGAIGISELTKMMSDGERLEDTAPAYCEAAKTVKELYNSDRIKLFAAEALNCIIMYIRPLLGPRISPNSSDVFPSAESQKWLAQFAGSGGDEGFYRRLLVELPALHNFVGSSDKCVLGEVDGVDA